MKNIFCPVAFIEGVVYFVATECHDKGNSKNDETNIGKQGVFGPSYVATKRGERRSFSIRFVTFG